ncbi:MAG: TonB family protein [Opitutaceae bacterium]
MKNRLRGFMPLVSAALALTASPRVGAAPVVEMALLDQKPKLVHMEHPVCPESFRAEGKHGSVRLEVVIDTGGNVIQIAVIDSSDPRLAKPAIEAAAKWTFTPGIKAGEPVNVRMPIFVGFETDEARAEANSKAHFIAPKAIHQEDPEYPFAFIMSRISGVVIVEFTVDREGNVVRPAIIKSSHPDFEAPAIEAILKWKFRPGTRDGVPVETRLQIPVSFQLRANGYRPAGSEAWAIDRRASTKLPKEFQYDEPPKPLVIGAPVYPYELLAQKIKGRATVTFAIAPSGRTASIAVVSASRPEFGAAAAAMVAAWTFEPAIKDGRPSWAILRREQVFDRDDPSFPVSESALRLLRDLKKTPCPVLTDARLLDAPIKGTYQPSPIVPQSVAEAKAPANATIEFIVDHAGHAQLPRIVTATNPDFAWAAATAVGRWQFTAPTVKGRPADVLVSIPMNYEPAAAGQTEAVSAKAAAPTT